MRKTIALSVMFFASLAFCSPLTASVPAVTRAAAGAIS